MEFARKLMILMFLFFAFYLICPAVPVLYSQDSSAVQNMKLQVQPREIKVSDFYNGSKVKVDIFVPAQGEITVKFAGKPTTIVLERKGRKGIFWLNVDEITLNNAPQAYMLFFSQKLSDMAPKDTILSLGLGYDALSRQIGETEGQIAKPEILSEFFRFKEKSKLYHISNELLQPENPSDRLVHYSLLIPVNSAMPVGEYQVTVYFFEDGKCKKQLSDTLTIQKVGFVKFVSGVAMEHAALYGILAILIAVMAGFSIGILFNFLKKR